MSDVVGVVEETKRPRRARRAAREGSVYRRASDGKWVGVATVSRRADGRARRRVVYGATQAAALEKLSQLKSDAREGRLVEPSKLTLDAFLRAWIDRLVQKGRIRQRTVDEYRRLAGLITRHIGSDLLASITPARVEQLYAAWGREGLGQRSAQAAARVLHGACKDAVRQRLLAVNPCLSVDTPKVEAPEREIFSGEQVRALIRVAEQDRSVAGPLAILLLATGLRIGEALGLAWRHVDFALRVVRIERVLSETTAGVLSFAPPKTKRSRRAVRLPAFAVAALLGHWERSSRPAPDRLVFEAAGGKPWRRSNLARRAWFPLLQAAELPRLGFHATRHSHATLMLQNGVSLLTVAARLGHSRASVTTDIYGHVLPGDDQVAADRADLLLGTGAAH